MSAEQLIQDARSQAAALTAGAQAEMSNAGSQLSSIYNDGGLAVIDAVGQITLPELRDITFAVPPALTHLTIDSSGAPGTAPQLSEVPDPMDGLSAMPNFNGVAPSISLPSKPGQVAAFTGTSPTVNTSFTIPTAPAGLNLVPLEPTLGTYTIPTAPQLVIPVFSDTAPADQLPAQADYVGEFTSAYRDIAPTMSAILDSQLDTMLHKINPRYHGQMTAIEDQLDKYLAGGTGLNSAIENAIYERAKDKNNAEYSRTRDAVYADTAGRGFTMPSGALFSASQQARQAAADNNARASVEIAIKMAEMEQQNLQFAVTTSAALRNAVLSASLSYHGNLVQINGQALDYAKSVLTALVDVYDTALKVYTAKLDAYRTKAQVFSTRIQALSATMDLYRSEIAAMEAMVNVDRAKVDIYRARIDSMGALANTYRTQIEAVVSQATLEKAKVEIFGMQVQAYSAQVQGKSAEWQGYSAAVNGEEAKIKMYSEQANVYNIEVGAYKTKVEAKMSQVQAAAVRNRSIMDAYTGAYSAYASKMQAEQARVGAEGEFQRNLLTEYGQANSAAIAQASAEAERFRLVAQVAMEKGRLDHSVIQERARVRLGAAQGLAQTALGAANTYSSMASAALAGMNTLVTVQQS